MGVYNTYAGVQLKVGGNLVCRNFKIGDKVDIPDGAYLGYGGIVVIIDNKLCAIFKDLIDTYGNIIDKETVLDPNNPIVSAIKKMKRKK